MGTADGGLWERKYRVLQDACSRLYLADYALICLSAILGHFLLGSTMENLTTVLHALLKELFLGRPCALSGRHCGVSSQGRYLASYQPKDGGCAVIGHRGPHFRTHSQGFRSAPSACCWRKRPGFLLCGSVSLFPPLPRTLGPRSIQKQSCVPEMAL